jgi:hypothetical protein
VDVTLGAFYLGRTSRQDITLQTFQTLFDSVSMRVLQLTVAPTIELGINERTHFTVSAGGGFYNMSLLLDQGFSEFDVNDSHFGVLAGAGVIRQVGNNWFVGADLQLNKIWTSADIDDLFYIFSEGDSNPVFYNINVGLMLRLF